MDKIKKFCVVITFLALSVISFAQQSSGVYEYPVKPGSDQWKTFTTHTEMINSCQIPNTILQKMSTGDLVETCLNYPLYMDMFAYNQLQNGFDVVTAHFNGLQVFLNREDAGTVLLEKYKKMDPEAFDQNLSLIKKGEYAAKFYYVEILIAQETILSNLQPIQRKLLLEECIRKFKEKEKYPEVYDALSYRNILLIAGRIMAIEKFDPLINKTEIDKRLKVFLQNGFTPDANIVKELFNLAVQYLNQK
jgi:hypothetical protein